VLPGRARAKLEANASPVTPPAHPNIILIQADDLGYGDLSCYGRPDYKTPVLDRLAAQGLKFTSNYAAAPVCTPTRCGFITGRYPQRLAVGLEEPLTRRSPQVGLPAGHATIGIRLQAAGYATGLGETLAQRAITHLIVAGVTTESNERVSALIAERVAQALR